MIWKFLYTVYPPFLRILERLHFHSSRQDFLVGKLNEKYTAEDFKKFLASRGFSPALLAWQDPGEILNVRRLHEKVFQYHIRLFADGEIRAHYEYSSEGNPFFHIFNIGFRNDPIFFQELLGEYLLVPTSEKEFSPAVLHA